MTVNVICSRIEKKVKIVDFKENEELGQVANNGKIVEVRGKVKSDDLTISVHDLTVYNDEYGYLSHNHIDMQQHIEMINYYHKFCKD